MDANSCVKEAPRTNETSSVELDFNKLSETRRVVMGDLGITKRFQDRIGLLIGA
jgi:hypothetical protein